MISGRKQFKKKKKKPTSSRYTLGISKKNKTAKT